MLSDMAVMGEERVEINKCKWEIMYSNQKDICVNGMR